MKEFVLRECFEKLLAELLPIKKLVFLSVVITTIACAGWGYFRYWQAYQADSAKLSQIQTYERTMKNFDEGIKTTELNIKTTQKQIDDRNAYVNKAVLMKLNPNQIEVAETGYLIQIGAGARDRLAALIGLYDHAAKSGNIVSSIEKKNPKYKGQFLQDVVSVIRYDKLLIFRVMHYDKAEAKAIMELFEKALAELGKTMKIPHSLALQERHQYTIASEDIKKKQLTVQNELRNNRNMLTNYKNGFADQQNRRTYYEKMNKPVTLVSSSPVKTLFKYSAFGVFLGLLWPVLWVFYNKVIKA